MSRSGVAKRAVRRLVKRVDAGNFLKMIMRAGQAQPGPPLGPLLGQHGIPIGSFCKDFNERTKDIKTGIPLPVCIRIKADRTYDLDIHPPTSSYFLLAAAGIEKGASQPGHEEAGVVSLPQLYEIARVKIEDPGFKLRGFGLEDVVRSLLGSARSLGLRVVPRLSVEECTTFRQRRADELAAQALKEAEAAT